MPDIYLRAGEVAPADVRLYDPTAAPSGGATTYTYGGSGALILAGAALLTKEKVFLVSGGLLLAGTAPVNKLKAFLPTGGAVFGGTAALLKSKTYTPTGGLALVGIADVLKMKVFTSSGGAVFAGAAATAFEGFPILYLYEGSGAVIFAGFADAFFQVGSTATHHNIVAAICKNRRRRKGHK